MISIRLRQLAQLRSRLFRQRATLAAVAVLLAALLFVAFVDVRIGLPWIARLAALAAILTGGALIFRRLKGGATARDAARLVEAAHPDLGQSVRTTAQVAPLLDASRPPIEAALVAQTTRRTAALPLDREIAPRRALAPAAFAAGALAIAWLIALCVSPDWRTAAGRALGLPIKYTAVKAAAFPEALKADETVRIVATLSGRRTQQARVHLRTEGEGWREVAMTPVAAQQFDAMLPGLAKPLEFYVTSGDGRSRAGRVAVHIPPKLQRISAHLEFPSYLGLPPIEQTGGDLEAVEGTKAQVELEFDRPVAEARVIFPDHTSAPIAIDGTRGRVEIVLPPSERTWHIAGRDPAGAEFETPPHRLKGSVDKPPTVKLAEPRDELEVTPLHELIARVQARDDHGLATVGIVLQVGTTEEKLLEKNFEAPDVRQAAEMATAFLEEHALTLNDSLLVYAYATDHKPRAGARVVSAMAAVDIREFKRLYILADAKACECNNLLEKMIAQQRRVFSDTTQLRELSANQEVPRALVLPLAERELKVDGLAHQLQELLEEDLDLESRPFQEAATQIVGRLHTAVASLQARRLAEACTGENVALTDMLKLRKQMLYKRVKNKPNTRMTDSKPKREEDERPTLTQLAEQLEKAAKEEHAVAEQAQALSGEAPAALRRQQEAVTGDVGEVLGELDEHPNATDTARQRGTQAEALMHAAAKALAAAPLADAEAALRELAAHLRLLDQPPDENALAKLEKRAEEAAECLANCAKCATSQGTANGKSKDSKSGQLPAGGEEPGDASEKSAALAEQAPKEGAGKEKPKDGKDGKAQASGERPADFSEKIAALAEQAVTLDDALRRWSSGFSLSQTESATPLGRLKPELQPELQRTAQLATELRALSKDVASGSAGTAAQAEALASRQQDIAAALRKERDALRQTRAQQLAQLRQRVQGASADNFIGVANAKGGIEPSGATKQRLVRIMQTAEGADIIAALRATGDSDLEVWAGKMERNVKWPVFAWQTLRGADTRLATMLAELKRTAPVAIRESTVPDQYRRVVESYFRALSEDFDDEEKGAPMPARK